MRAQSKTRRSASAFSMNKWLALLGLAGFALLLWQPSARSQEPVERVPPPLVDEPAGAGGTETAVVSGGCFWGVQGVFQHVKGVTRAVSGYAGGNALTAHYQMVGTGLTGHAESVQISYDPKQISYGQLLQIFFSVAHDPTELNRQGPDSGTQYRSAIFPANPLQQHIADSYIAQLDKAKVFQGSIVTKTDPLKGFYPAEDYHQDFLALNPDYPYIVYNDLPKVRNLKLLFPERYRDKPVLALADSQAKLEN
jgi:peptide-methionine (S)-S-oxide reductase